MLNIPEQTVILVEGQTLAVTKLVGYGTLGGVWQVQDTAGQFHAIKVITRPGGRDYHQDFLNRLAIYRKLEHRHLVPLEFFGMLPAQDGLPYIQDGKWQTVRGLVDGWPFFIMPYADARLDTFFQFQEDDAGQCDLALQLCLGVRFLQHYWIEGPAGRLEHFFHGNLKPSNLLIFTKGARHLLQIADVGMCELATARTNQYLPAASGTGGPASVFYADYFAVARLVRELLTVSNAAIQSALNKMEAPTCQEADLVALIKALHEQHRYLTSKKIAHNQFILGLQVYQQGLYQYACNDFDRAIALDPTLTAAHLYRAECLRHLGQYDAALVGYNQVLTLNNHDPLGYESRGQLYAERQEYALAIADLTRAVELDPEAASAYGSLGMVYRELGEYAKALEQFDRLLSLVADCALGYVDRGDVLVQMGKTSQATADYQKALELGCPDKQEVQSKLDKLGTNE